MFIPKLTVSAKLDYSPNKKSTIATWRSARHPASATNCSRIISWQLGFVSMSRLLGSFGVSTIPWDFKTPFFLRCRNNLPQGIEPHSLRTRISFIEVLLTLLVPPTTHTEPPLPPKKRSNQPNLPVLQDPGPVRLRHRGHTSPRWQQNAVDHLTMNSFCLGCMVTAVVCSLWRSCLLITTGIMIIMIMTIIIMMMKLIEPHKTLRRFAYTSSFPS